MSQSLREPKEFRRSFIQKSGILAVGVAASALPATLLAKEKEEEEVSTNEDLMREHGILKRVLLVYDEVIRRIRSNREFPPEATAWVSNSKKSNVRPSVAMDSISMWKRSRRSKSSSASTIWRNSRPNSSEWRVASGKHAKF